MKIDLVDTERTLLEDLSADVPGAFEHLFDLHWEKLYQKAYARLRNEAEAQDMVQDIFVSMWQRRGNLQINTSLEAYLSTALKYKIIKFVSNSDLHEKAVAHLVQRMEQIETTILDELIANDVKKTLTVAVASFPENMRKIFALKTQDYSLNEIAEALGLSKQTVKNNNTEALRRLRIVLMEKHPDINKSFYVLLLLLTKS